MSNWKVSLENIEIIEHPTADKMEIGKVGSYQVVVQKGLYKTGDVVAFAPEKSVIPDDMKAPWEKYLAGSNHNRVKSVRLRNEWSCGIIIPLETIKERLGYVPEVGTDISEQIGIKKYEAPIPVELAGDVTRAPEGLEITIGGKHDCEHYRAYASEFNSSDVVVATEKIHGSQFVCNADRDGLNVAITSKGLRDKELFIKESKTNAYWRAFWFCGVDKILKEISEQYEVRNTISVFGELVPCQGGYTYGVDRNNPRVFLFDVRVDGVSIPFDIVVQKAKDLWVPVLYHGLFDEETILNLCEGNETVSGKRVHIREGIVLRPYIDRRAKDGSRLAVKIINPDYKETGEEFS